MAIKWQTLKGTVVSIGKFGANGAEPATYTTLVGAKSVELAGVDKEQNNVTTFASNGWNEYQSGQKEATECSVDLLVNIGSAEDTLLRELLFSDENAKLKISFPTNSGTSHIITYTGFVSGYNPSGELGNVAETTLVFKVSGEPEID